MLILRRFQLELKSLDRRGATMTLLSQRRASQWPGERDGLPVTGQAVDTVRRAEIAPGEPCAIGPTGHRGECRKVSRVGLPGIVYEAVPSLGKRHLSGGQDRFRFAPALHGRDNRVADPHGRRSAAPLR